MTAASKQQPHSRDGFIWTESEQRDGLKTAAVHPSSASSRDSYDAIVVGAGFSGLIAARELSRLEGTRVLLVEARDRVGGRTFTANELGEDIEMGGTWVHWNQPHVYSELCRYGLQHNLKPTIAAMTPEESAFFTKSGLQELDCLVALDRVEEVCQKFFTIDGYSSRDLMPYPHEPLREPKLWLKYDDLSVSDRLNQIQVGAEDRQLFEAYVALFGLNSPSEIGFTEALRWYALGGHSMAATYELSSVYKLGKGGMTSFANAILEDTSADVLFSTEVRKIEQTASHVCLTDSRNRTIKAKVLVCTIPLNCLGDIQFSPPLSPKRREASSFGQQNMGGKLHFKLSDVQPLWFGNAAIDGSTPYLLAFADHNGTKPTGADGTYCIAATNGASIRDLKQVQPLIKEFKKVFRPKCEVEAYLVHDWASDPYSKGLWSCWKAGGMGQFIEELQRPQGRVLFANSDWANGWRGFIDGALESGKRAARDAEAFLNSSEGRAML